MANNIFEILGMSSSTSDIKQKLAMFENPFSFDGRIRRTEYGISFILYLIIYLELINFVIHPDQKDNNPIAFILIAIPALWFLWAQGAKRCHDLGNSGWYQLIPFYVFWMLFQDGQAEENEYGENPKEIHRTENQNLTKQTNNPQSSLSSADENLFQKAMKIYRQAQPPYEANSITFPEFNKEKLYKAYQLFCTCIEIDSNNVDALLMKAQCIYDLYDKEKMPDAMKAIDKAIQLNPNNPFAHDIRGALSYSWNSDDDKERTIKLIENKKKVLILNPQYSNDLGYKISFRTTTNAAFRSDLEGLERGLEKIRIEQKLKEETQSAAQTKEAPPLTEFKEITTESPEEAANALCKEAVQAIPAISETKVRKHYLDVSSGWESKQLFEGSTEKITSIVLENLQRLHVQQGFQYFQVKVYLKDECVQISAFFSRGGGYSFQPVRVWRSTEKMFVCGNAAFS